MLYAKIGFWASAVRSRIEKGGMNVSVQWRLTCKRGMAAKKLEQATLNLKVTKPGLACELIQWELFNGVSTKFRAKRVKVHEEISISS